MLELARAIAARPRLLLLDEVMAGLRAPESDRIVEIVRSLKAEGVTVLLIEYHARGHGVGGPYRRSASRREDCRG